MFILNKLYPKNCLPFFNNSYNFESNLKKRIYMNKYSYFLHKSIIHVLEKFSFLTGKRIIVKPGLYIPLLQQLKYSHLFPIIFIVLLLFYLYNNIWFKLTHLHTLFCKQNIQFKVLGNVAISRRSKILFKKSKQMSFIKLRLLSNFM